MSESNMALWSETVLRIVSHNARRAARLHEGYADYEDFQGEGYVWVGRHPDKVRQHIENKHPGLLSQDIYRAMHKFAMKQRYLKDGTQQGDYFLYPLAVLQEILPEVLNGPEAADSAPADINAKIRARRPVNERGDKAAMVADVQRAYKALCDDDKALLWAKYGNGGQTDDALAVALGRPQQTVNYQCRRALRRMAEFLGGEPWQRRKAISNARAIHETGELA